MTRLFVLTREGEENEIAGRNGFSVMELIRGAGIDEILAACGGCCSCATCHVYVDETSVPALPPMSVDEDDLLETLVHRHPNSRLSCQIKFAPELDGLTVTIAPEE